MGLWNNSWVKNLAVSSLYVRSSKTPGQLCPISQVSWVGPTNHKVTKKCLEPWITFSEVAASLFCLIKWIHVLHNVRILKSEGVSSSFLCFFIGFTDKLTVLADELGWEPVYSVHHQKWSCWGSFHNTILYISAQQEILSLSHL